jgi:hypothetical protein
MSGNGSVTIRHATSADKEAVGDLAHRLLSDVDAPRFDPQGYAAAAAFFVDPLLDREAQHALSQPAASIIGVDEEFL